MVLDMRVKRLPDSKVILLKHPRAIHRCDKIDQFTYGNQAMPIGEKTTARLWDVFPKSNPVGYFQAMP